MSIEAGWAYFAKRPGAYDDNAVIASSLAPFAAAEFLTLIRTFVPGDISDTAPVDGPAWATFTARAKAGPVPYFGIAVEERTAHYDGQRRPIYATTYACVRLDDVVGRGVGYRALYTAVREALGWLDPETAENGGMVRLDVPPADPAARAALVDGFGYERVAMAAAAAMSGSPVALTGAGGMGLEQRIDFLDAVTALLPAGAPGWLSAATWIDRADSHPFVLAFPLRTREIDVAVPVQGGAVPPEVLESLYYRTLTDVRDSLGSTQAVVVILAGLGSQREPDPMLAARALIRDDPRSVVRKVREGRGDGDEVRELLAVEQQWSSLSPDEQALLLGFLIRTPAELHKTNTSTLAARWVPELTSELLGIAGRSLWQGQQTVVALAPLVALGEIVTQGDFLARIIVAPTGVRPTVAQLERAAELIRISVPDPATISHQLAAGVTGHRMLYAVLLAQEFSAGGHPAQPAPDLSRLARWGRLNAARPRIDEPDPARPFLHLGGCSATAPTGPDLNALVSFGPNLLWPLLSHLAAAGPLTVAEGELLIAVLDLVNGRPPGGEDHRVQLAAMLRRIDPAAADLRARLDLTVLRFGGEPGTDLTSRLVTPDGNNYINAFQNAYWSLESPTARPRVIAGVTRLLPAARWAFDQRYSDAVLFFMRTITHGPTGEFLVTPQVLDFVVSALDISESVFGTERFRIWWEQEIKHDQRLRHRVLEQQLRQLRQGTPRQTFQPVVIEALARGTRVDRVLEHLRRIRPSEEDMAELLTAVLPELAASADEVDNAMERGVEFVEKALHKADNNLISYFIEYLPSRLWQRTLSDSFLLVRVLDRASPEGLRLYTDLTDELRSRAGEFLKLAARLDHAARGQRDGGGGRRLPRLGRRRREERGTEGGPGDDTGPLRPLDVQRPSPPRVDPADGRPVIRVRWDTW